MPEPTPLTLSELLDQLCEIIRAEPALCDAPVTFGPDATPVCGGIAQRRGGRPILNLAPMRLDQVGGF